MNTFEKQYLAQSQQTGARPFQPNIPVGKMLVSHTIFLLNKDISQLLNEWGHIEEKLQFYEVNTFIMSLLHNCIPKYLSFVKFLPNLCLTFPAGMNQF